MRPATHPPIIVLGAGLSGLSLTCALLDAGVRSSITLIDRRRGYTRDRTWCTWETADLRFPSAVTHRWASWSVGGPDGVQIATSHRHPYVHLAAERVYVAALERIDAAPTVTLCLGESVRDAVCGPGPGPGPGAPVRVTTSARTLEAPLVFDALGPHSPLAAGAPPDRLDFAQRFVGWEIESDRPVFNPAVATLMDFLPHAGVGVTFLYLLPFSPTRALIEHTAIEPLAAPAVDRDAALAEEIARRWPEIRYECRHRERGLIPMTPRRFPTERGPGLYTIGAAAGAIRPSSGYAYSRIQRQVSAVAGAVATGRPLPGDVADPRTLLLDRAFLQALASSPDPARLFQAAAAMEPDAFARFMTDAGGPRDVLAAVRALPVREMGAAALASLAGGWGRAGRRGWAPAGDGPGGAERPRAADPATASGRVPRYP
ncbi:lycopene cyclase family protein [Conexibacter sp. DBS9H8]|uniref:lycopene cyclase family protein n=1 Tax=Conexibacter sp. DBS9H8 TaxID=2937801 RepID=UPI0020102899|nr:lycopene cyclase family protein [Conexibacter sp. DBS9H8]